MEKYLQICTPLKATISHSEIEELFLLPEIFMWKDRSCNAGDYFTAVLIPV